MGGVSFLLAQMDEGSHSGLPYEDTSKRTVGPATVPANSGSRGGLPYLMSA